ncbi:MAG: galactokinase [Bacteroidales bacterium]|nr:galactokinase [Bacteroidales bacterium]
MREKLKTKFIEVYGSSDQPIHMYFSPGRVNLIGEHTDYNGGFVFPCAISYGTYLAVRLTNSETVKFTSTNFDFTAEISLEKISEKVGNEWINYPLGVINEMKKIGIPIKKGVELLFDGNIPNGAGLSSSASIETVTAYFINNIFGNNRLSREELAKLCQNAENNFVGVNCGIMDQFAVSMGKTNHAIFLNCDTLGYELVPLNLSGLKLIISNTNKQRKLADSKYNERRSECEQAVKALSHVKKIRNLGVLKLAQFQEMEGSISDKIIKKRALHVVSEDQRCIDAVDALKEADMNTFGRLMNESHDSLKENYEVTGLELDTLVEEARKIKGVLGSRMTGAGFGGCTVSLVKEEIVEEFINVVGAAYKNKTGLNADFYIADVGNGVRKLS